MKIGVLIPIYNEEKTIKKVIQVIKKYNNDIIIVSDGTTDNSLDIIKEENIKIIINKKNIGLVESLKKGFNYALKQEYDAIIKIDGDEQMGINFYKKFVQEYRENKKDLLIAGYCKEKISWMIKKDIWIYSYLFYLASGEKIKDIISEYRLFSRKAMLCYINSKIKDNASNLAIISLFNKGCSIKYIGDAVNYNNAHKRPFHIKGLIDLRINFICEIWKLKGIKSKFIGFISFFVLVLLFFFNITFGFRYNKLLSKKIIRK